LSVTGFAYEFLLSDNARINEFEIDASHSSIKLFSSPTVFDGNVMLQQVGFSTNTFSGNLGESIEVVVTPTNPVVDSSSDNTLSGNATTSDNTTTSDNVTTGTNTGTVDTTTTDTTTTDTTVTDTTVAKPRLKTRIKTLAEVSADHVYVFSLESPNLKESFLWEDLNNREITFDDADEIHRLTLKWIDDLGQVGGSFEQYYVPLSQPSTWAIGDDSIELSAAGFTLTLTREDSSEAWEVGVVKGNALIDAEQNTILVVQKSGGSERLSFSMTGSSGASAVSAESSSVSATGITLDKANLVVLGAPVSTSSVDSDVVSTSGSSSSSGGGGGGGCLLR
jgi:hypothetical protein